MGDWLLTLYAYLTPFYEAASLVECDKSVGSRCRIASLDARRSCNIHVVIVSFPKLRGKPSSTAVMSVHGFTDWFIGRGPQIGAQHA